MDKEIYDFLNDMDISLDRYEKEELSEFEKNKLKKDINKRINKEKDKPNSWKKRIIVIAASLIILFGFSRTEVGKNTYAIASELFTNIKYGIKEGLGFTDDIDKYSSKVDLISESEGIKLKLNDVIIDRDKVYFSFLVDIKKYVPKKYLEDEDIAFLLGFYESGSYEENYYITLNNKESGIIFCKTKMGRPRSKYKDGDFVKEIDNKESRDKGIFDIVVEAKNPLEYDMANLEDIDFNLVFNYLRIDVYETEPGNGKEAGAKDQNIGEIYGDWKFEFTKDAKELSIDTDRFELDKNLILDGLDLEFIELTSNSLGNKIKTKVKDKGLYEKKLRTDILLDGYDNLGQKRIFEFTLNRGKNIIMIEEYHNHIDFPQDRDIVDNPYPESNIDFKGVEYIEFTPYYQNGELYFKQIYHDPALSYKKMGEPFKLYLNK